MTAPGLRVDEHLGLELRETANGGITATLPVGPGGTRAGVVAVAVDAAGGLAAGLAALPRWVVTARLAVTVHHVDHVGPLRLLAAVVRVGRSTVVTEVDVHDDGAGGVLVADGTVTSAALEPRDGAPVLERPVVRAAGGPGAEALERFFRLAPVDDGVVLDLGRGAHLRNSWGILHGGATAVLVDAAATAAGRGRATGLLLHFVAPARVGPVVATPAVVGERADGRLMGVSVRDAGAGDRLVATATAIVRPG